MMELRNDMSKKTRYTSRWQRAALLSGMWIALASLAPSLIQQAYAQECSSPFNPDCIPGGGITPPSGACPSGQSPVGFCSAIICIEICRPIASSPPPFTGDSGSTSGGGAHGGGGTGGGATGGSGSTGTGGDTPPPQPYNFFADTAQFSNDDIAAIHWTRQTGSTADGRPMDTVSNAPLDGGDGQFMSPESKERVVAERQNYLNMVEGGLWSCNPFDDMATVTTSVVCEQLSSGYELPPGYTTVTGSKDFDGDYPNPPNKMTYRNWSEIHDGLTSGRLLDDPTNQTIILAAMTASAPAIYALGAAGDGAVGMLLQPAAEAQKALSVSEQVLAAAAVPGATLSSLVQTTTNALAKANIVTGPKLVQLTELMEKVEDLLKSQSRDIQVSVLEKIEMVPYEKLEEYATESPDTFLRFLNNAIRFTQEAPIRALLDATVRMADLQNEDVQATALRTLSEQAVGILPIENPTLAATLVRGLPGQISESLEYINTMLIDADGYRPVDIRFVPWGIEGEEIGPDGIARMSVVVNAIIYAVNSSGVSRMVQVLYSLPVPVVQKPFN
jgi:hypothetical protein